MRKLLIRCIHICLFVFIANLSFADIEIVDAVISDQSSNYLEVTFNENIEVSNAEGFRLTGGVARIKNLQSGSESNTLIFALTDFVLPDDEFSLLYWEELSDARSDESNLRSFDITKVKNQVSSYHGDKKIWYVSTSGSDAFKGSSPKVPLRTIEKAFSLASKGDYILLKKGDRFKDTFLEINATKDQLHASTLATYGSGAKPIITHTWKNLITISSIHDFQVDNLHLIVEGDGESGVIINGNSKNTLISNCTIESQGKPHAGIGFGKNESSQEHISNPQLINNQISGFYWNITSSGYPYDGTHEVLGGLIENNICIKTRNIENADGIVVQRGKFHNLIVRKNEVSHFFDDGIDLYGAEDVIVEYNMIHDPYQPAKAGQGIKAGGLTRSEPVKGHQSKNIIVRYNTVYNLINDQNDEGSYHGIISNDGASGKIYGNVIYNVKGNGIVISGPIKEWSVFNNTIVNAGNTGINIWTEGETDYNVKMANNIIDGASSDIAVNTRTSKNTIQGSNNLLLNGKTRGQYEGKYDLVENISQTFQNPLQNDFHLKSGSKAVNHAVELTQFLPNQTDKVIRQSSDIGALEYK